MKVTDRRLFTTDGELRDEYRHLENASAPDVAARPREAEAAEPVAADDEVDIHDLVDAPSHTDELIERLTEAFPGAELHTTEPPEDDR